MEAETEGGEECITENKQLLCKRNMLTSLFTSCSSLSLDTVGIGYSVFSHGNLNRALDIKSPPPLNLGSENLRGEAANQGMGTTRANHNSAVSSCYYPVWSTLMGVSKSNMYCMWHLLNVLLFSKSQWTHQSKQNKHSFFWHCHATLRNYRKNVLCMWYLCITKNLFFLFSSERSLVPGSAQWQLHGSYGQGRAAGPHFGWLWPPLPWGIWYVCCATSILFKVFYFIPQLTSMSFLSRLQPTWFLSLC